MRAGDYGSAVADGRTTAASSQEAQLLLNAVRGGAVGLDTDFAAPDARLRGQGTQGAAAAR